MERRSIFRDFSMSALSNVVAILRWARGREPDFGVGEVALGLDMPKSTASRLLKDMARQGLLERDAIPVTDPRVARLPLDVVERMDAPRREVPLDGQRPSWLDVVGESCLRGVLHEGYPLLLAAICRVFAALRTGFAGNSGSSATGRTEPVRERRPSSINCTEGDLWALEENVAQSGVVRPVQRPSRSQSMNSAHEPEARQPASAPAWRARTSQSGSHAHQRASA